MYKLSGGTGVEKVAGSSSSLDTEEETLKDTSVLFKGGSWCCIVGMFADRCTDQDQVEAN